VKTYFLIPLLLAGCASVPPTKTVKFESDPPGARVFVAYAPDEKSATGKAYLGSTPFEHVFEARGDGGFKLPKAFIYSTFTAPVAVFTAEPPHGSTNLYPQRQVFHGDTVIVDPDKIPPGMFFDMHKPPQ
jgi:hypothetical protein